MVKKEKNLTSCIFKEESLPMPSGCNKCNPRNPKKRCRLYIPWQKNEKKEKEKNIIYHVVK